MRGFKSKKTNELTAIPAENVMPIQPAPTFTTRTVYIRIPQGGGGFMDDENRWHKAPPRIIDAVRINGIWYWARYVRNYHGRNNGDILVAKSLLFPAN